jgi:hypothetical protein
MIIRRVHFAPSLHIPRHAVRYRFVSRIKTRGEDADAALEDDRRYAWRMVAALGLVLGAVSGLIAQVMS